MEQALDTRATPLARAVRHGRWVLRYRELVRNLVVRDLKARYKNSVLGFLWSLLNPLLMMAVFTVVFKVLMPNDIPNYPLFVLLGILPWNWCTASVMGGITSIVGNGHLIKKVAFPRELLPISVVISNMVNFLLALIPLGAMMVAFGVMPTPLLALLPLIIVLQLVFLCGLALFLSCLQVYFRDTGVIFDVLLLAWFFLSPVFYRVEDLTEQWARLMYILNPMASFISLYRLVVLYGAPPDALFMLRLTAQAALILAVGYVFFVRYSHSFAEEV
ncbi:MAG: ABC transporter permease [Chloroflexi bacterium]|nr:ABC transporter permease [Chloroflexota bacterium]MBI4507109.1 ABC transporter permease [Chloroflexota bacterium]